MTSFSIVLIPIFSAFALWALLIAREIRKPRRARTSAHEPIAYASRTRRSRKVRLMGSFVRS